MEKNCLIIFIKNPGFGKVKTRLAAEIGESGALAVYLKLLNHTMEVCQNLRTNKIVYYSDFIDTEDEWENNLFDKAIQRGSDLGERMKNAFKEQFSQGYKKVCIIGSDIPELNDKIINQAFYELDNHDTVIGPAVDGGYYLLGMKKLIENLFEKKQWGSNTVLESTVQDLNIVGNSYFRLPVLTDIDTKKDLQDTWPEFKWNQK